MMVGVGIVLPRLVKSTSGSVGVYIAYKPGSEVEIAHPEKKRLRSK